MCGYWDLAFSRGFGVIFGVSVTLLGLLGDLGFYVVLLGFLVLGVLFVFSVLACGLRYRLGVCF